MPTLPVRIFLFLSSYAPLFGLLAYRNSSSDKVLIGFTLAAVVPVIMVGGYLLIARSGSGTGVTIMEARPREAEVLAYVAAYLVPFLALDLTKTKDLVSLLVFLLVLGVVSVTSDQVFINPILSLLGFHFFEASDTDGNEMLLIARRPAFDRRPTPIRVVKAGSTVRLEVRRDRS